jgi:hypothetical protein
MNADLMMVEAYRAGGDEPSLCARYSPALSRRIATLRELRSSACTADDARVLAALKLTRDPFSASGRTTVPEGVPPGLVPSGATTVQPQFPNGGVSLEVMKAIARDERVTAEECATSRRLARPTTPV